MNQSLSRWIKRLQLLAAAAIVAAVVVAAAAAAVSCPCACCQVVFAKSAPPLLLRRRPARARAFAKKERAIFFAKRTEELVADLQLSVRISQVKAELTFCSSHPQTKKREKNVNIFGGVCFRFDSKKS